MRAGAVWVPINSRNTPDANIEYMNYVDDVLAFLPQQFAKRSQEIKQRVSILRHLFASTRMR